MWEGWPWGGRVSVLTRWLAAAPAVKRKMMGLILVIFSFLGFLSLQTVEAQVELKPRKECAGSLNRKPKGMTSFMHS